jgi:archaemetzincin
MAKDLCLPFLTHVFGEAQLAGCSAVVSLYRLWGPGLGDKSELLLQRAAKVALHEVAHVMGLVHCRNRHCLMNFSPSLEHLDQLEMILCPNCSKLLHRQRLRLMHEASGANAAWGQ